MWKFTNNDKYGSKGSIEKVAYYWHPAIGILKIIDLNQIPIVSNK